MKLISRISSPNSHIPPAAQQSKSTIQYAKSLSSLTVQFHVPKLRVPKQFRLQIHLRVSIDFQKLSSPNPRSNTKVPTELNTLNPRPNKQRNSEAQQSITTPQFAQSLRNSAIQFHEPKIFVTQQFSGANHDPIRTGLKRLSSPNTSPNTQSALEAQQSKSKLQY